MKNLVRGFIVIYQLACVGAIVALDTSERHDRAMKVLH
jgi:hypothetical protein